jgi:hypothetical protein
MTHSIKFQVGNEVDWLLSKPWYEAGDIDEACKRVIKYYPVVTPTYELAKTMITDSIAATIMLMHKDKGVAYAAKHAA